MISPTTLGFFPLFADFEPELQKKIAMLADEQTVEPGHQLFFEGEVAKTLFIIREGSVVLTMNMVENGEQKVQEMEPLSKGELFGWSSIVKPHIYKLGAYAGQECRLVAFDAEKLGVLLDENPSAGYFFMKRLAEVIGERLIGKCVQLMSLVN